MSEKDGGPAFPALLHEREASPDRPDRYYIPLQAGGMSLRDYFAAHAPAPDAIAMTYMDAEQQRSVYRAAAENAYLWADAMLKAREK